jgi:exopolysaccharide biosynthesis polyprenyl glycosylphosphotransferase
MIRLSKYISEKERMSLLVTISLIICDILSIAISMYLGYQFYHLINIGVGPQPAQLYFKLTLITVLVMIFIFEMVGLYERELSILNIQEVRKIFKATLIGLLLFFLLTFYLKNVSFSRLIITFSAIFMFAIVSFERVFFYRLYQKLHLRGFGVSKVLIYGAGEVGQLLLKRLFQSPSLGYMPVGFIDDNIEKVGKVIKSNSSASNYTLPILGTLEDLEDLIQSKEIDELFVTITSLKMEKFSRAIHKCRQLGVNLRFVPNLFDLKIQKIMVSGIDGIPLLSIKEPKISSIYAPFKRLFDIIFSALALILLSPFILLISSIIKHDSRGGAIFKQKRIGLKGKEFTFYKFRTMWEDTKPYDWTPISLDDSRITPFGKFLRRTSLDELPQFWNVLKGDMSLVGPRPEMPFIVEMYNEIQRDRLAVKPGITGLWQISADRGRQIHDNIEYDLYYIDNCGFLLDLVIIIRTFYFAVRGIGAF